MFNKRIFFLTVGISVLTFTLISGCGDKKAPEKKVSIQELSKKSAAVPKAGTKPETEPVNADAEHLKAQKEELTAVRGTEDDTPGTRVLSVALGASDSGLPGKEQDKEGLTDGFPPAYDVDEKGNIHILDPVNKRIAVYEKSGQSNALTFSRSISLANIPGLSEKARVLSDISGPSGDSYAVLDKTAGMVFVIDLKGEVKWYISGQKLAKHIYLNHDGRLFVASSEAGEPDKVVIFDSKEKPLSVYEGSFIKPWFSMENKLFSINNTQSPSMLETVDIDTKEKKPFASINPVEGMTYAGADIMAVTSGGFPVIAVLSAKAVNANTPDQRETYKKSIVSFDNKGKQLTSIFMSQPFMNIMVTPRLHRVGRDDMLYTLRIEENKYNIYKKEL
jgi:hypothetical protein